jgi:hypothetical protein
MTGWTMTGRRQKWVMGRRSMAGRWAQVGHAYTPTDIKCIAKVVFAMYLIAVCNVSTLKDASTPSTWVYPYLCRRVCLRVA